MLKNTKIDIAIKKRKTIFDMFKNYSVEKKETLKKSWKYVWSVAGNVIRLTCKK